MTVLSLLNPFGWFGSGGPAKLSGGNQPSGDGISSYAGKPVTPERALELAAYWACVKIIAQTIGTLSCRLYNQAENGSRLPALDNPLYDLLLHQPNADHSAVEFWEGVGACLAIWGNSFALKGIVGDRVVALDLLRPWLMQVSRNEDGEPVYRYNDPASGLQTYSPDDLFVVRGFGVCDLTGFSPIQFARQTIGSAIAADESAGSLFRNSMRMSGWFKYKGGNGVLNQEQQKDTRAALVAPNIGSENAGKVGLLPGDFDWLPTAINPDDAQLIENRRMGVEEICRFFGVPPILVGHSAQGQTMWGTGVDSIVLGFMTTGLRPYLKRIEAAISRDIIGRSARQTLVVAFDVTELLRGDNKGQAEIDQSLANTGIKTRNEIRAERNMPPMPGGDTLTVQSALLPIEKLGEVAQLPAEKPVDQGADITAAEKLLARGFKLGVKYSENQQRDPRGRFAAGGGAGGAESATPDHPPFTTREKVIGGLALAAVAGFAIDALTHRKTPYRSRLLEQKWKAEDLRGEIGRLHGASIHTKLSDAEKSAVKAYASTDVFKQINKSLRLGHKPSDQIRAIDGAISKSAISENTVVFRGLNKDRSNRIIKAGAEFVDKGFVSTSIYEPIAREQFAKKSGYVVSINLDKGTPALPIDKSDAAYDDFEVLLPRSSAFKILSVDHDTKTIYAQHTGVATGKSAPKSAASGSSGGRFAWDMSEFDVFEPPSGDTTAQDYVGYRPPQPDDDDPAFKAFDPGEARDNQGQWTAGGGNGGGQSDTDPFGYEGYKPGRDWEVAKDAAFSVATGVAITAAVGITAALLPELFAVAGSAAAIEAGVEAGSLAKVTTAVHGLAEGTFWNAGMASGKVILNHLGLDTAKAEDTLKSVIGLAPTKAAGASADAQLKAGLTAVADHTRDEMVAHLNRHRIAPEKMKAARDAIDAACTEFKAKLA